MKGEDAIRKRSEEKCIAIDTALHSAPGWGTGVPVPILGVSGHCKVNGRGDPRQRKDIKNKSNLESSILNVTNRQVKFVTSRGRLRWAAGEAPEKGQQPGSSGDRIPGDFDEKMGGCDEEADQPKIRIGPKMPSKREREQHGALHLPYRSWRRHCVRMRGQSSPHARGSRGVESEEVEAERTPRICMDYFFVSQEDERASANPLLLPDDEANGNKYMRPLGRKGLGEGNEMEWLIKDVHDELKSWGYPGGGESALILKSDGEPAIVAVREAIARFHGGQISPEQSATRESQSNGRAEVSGKVIRGVVKVFKGQLEYKTKTTIASSDVIMRWLVSWAAMIYSRFKVGADGKSPYERVHGRKCNVLVIHFGEKVMYKMLSETGEKNGIMESDWEEGIWLGHARQSNEILVGTEEGMVRAWAAKRLTEEERWDGKMIKGIKGTPARPNPNGPGSDIPIRISVPSSGVEFKEGPPARSDDAPRTTYLKKEDFDRHGYSDNCEGCRRRRTGGMGQREHTAECRKRMETTLEKEENLDGRERRDSGTKSGGTRRIYSARRR